MRTRPAWSEAYREGTTGLVGRRAAHAHSCLGAYVVDTYDQGAVFSQEMQYAQATTSLGALAACRIGMSTGVMNASYLSRNPTSGRMTYSAAPLKLAKAVCDSVHGGQVRGSVGQWALSCCDPSRMTRGPGARGPSWQQQCATLCMGDRCEGGDKGKRSALSRHAPLPPVCLQLLSLCLGVTGVVGGHAS